MTYIFRQIDDTTRLELIEKLIVRYSLKGEVIDLLKLFHSENCRLEALQRIEKHLSSETKRQILELFDEQLHETVRRILRLKKRIVPSGVLTISNMTYDLNSFSPRQRVSISPGSGLEVEVERKDYGFTVSYSGKDRKKFQIHYPLDTPNISLVNLSN